MKVLFYGAGVLGSLYAARFQEVGHDVTVLARGQRLRELQEQGILLQPAGGGPLEKVQVKVVDRFDPDDSYDLVVVLVRRQQLGEVLPILAANHCTPNILFMVNNPAGPREILQHLPRERVLLGFAGAGGVRDDGIVRYTIAPGLFQPTTLGELTGLRTPRLERFLFNFRDAGFPVSACADMDAWLKTHAAWVIPTAGAVYLAGGSVRRLAHTRDALVMLVRAVRENLAVLRALGVPLTPSGHWLWQLIPEPLLVQILVRVLDTQLAENAIEQHARVAREDEMPVLAEEFRHLALHARLAAPSAEVLYTAMNPQFEPLPSGSRALALDWRGTILAAWVLLSVIRLVRFFRGKGK